MKNVTTNRNVAATVAFILLSLIATTSFASGNEKKEAAKKQETAFELKYIGKVDEQPILQVKFTNDSEEEVLFVLKDVEGNVLYSESFAGKVFTKKFMFQADGATELQLELSVYSKKLNQTQVYTVRKNSVVVDDVTITKQ